MNASVKQEIVKDILGLSAVLIFLGTMMLAAFRWSAEPFPAGALASLPLLALVAFAVRRKCRTFYARRDNG